MRIDLLEVLPCLPFRAECYSIDIPTMRFPLEYRLIYIPNIVTRNTAIFITYEGTTICVQFIICNDNIPLFA